VTKIVEKHRVHCSIRHADAFIVKWDDGSFRIKCGLLKACGDLCPYLKDPDYKSPFGRAPKYAPG
jgi:hypothetical protein